MITSNEIANKRFGKSMSGYRPEEVDSFLSEIVLELNRRDAEKKELERKLEILADKLEEYRRDEDSLRNALLGAQKLGDSVIRESKTKAEIIMRDATIKSERMVKNAEDQIEASKQSLFQMQKEVANFKNRLLALYKEHLELVTALPDDNQNKKAEEPAPAEAQADSALENDVLTPEADGGVEIPTAQSEEPEEMEAGFEVPLAEELEEPAEEDDKSSRFGPLKFGQGFSLKHDK